MTLEKKHNPI